MKRLIKFELNLLCMGRSFEEWWSNVLLHLHLAGKHDAKPSHEELKDWLHSGQVDVLRMAPKK